MKVSVTIVSGATLVNVRTMDIDFSSDSLTTGSFTYKAPRDIETEVDVDEIVTLSNQSGHKITFRPTVQHEVLDGRHEVNLSGKDFPSNKNLSGTYQGSIVATINYL